ncbi:MAG: bacteriohemerythrin [Spirulina sp.]
MALAYWRDDVKTHHPQIDSKHEEILTLLRRLYQDIMLNESGTAIQSTLDALFVCVLDHSEIEELLMRQYEYPELRSHTDNHEVILSKIFNLRLRAESHDLEVTTEMVHGIAHCISVHHRTYDISMIQYIQRQDESFPHMIKSDEFVDLEPDPMD